MSPGLRGPGARPRDGWVKYVFSPIFSFSVVKTRTLESTGQTRGTWVGSRRRGGAHTSCSSWDRCRRAQDINPLITRPGRKEGPRFQRTHAWDCCFSVKPGVRLLRLLRKGRRVSGNPQELPCSGPVWTASTFNGAGSRGRPTPPGCPHRPFPPGEPPLPPVASADDTPGLASSGPCGSHGRSHPRVPNLVTRTSLGHEGSGRTTPTGSRSLGPPVPREGRPYPPQLPRDPLPLKHQALSSLWNHQHRLPSLSSGLRPPWHLIHGQVTHGHGATSPMKTELWPGCGPGGVRWRVRRKKGTKGDCPRRGPAGIPGRTECFV